MKKNKISLYAILVSVFTLLAIFFFVVQKSYSNLMKPINDTKASNILKPIDPNLDVSILDEIENRQFQSVDNLPVMPPNTVPTP